jgi:sugar lactone lactonase YvrE
MVKNVRPRIVIVLASLALIVSSCAKDKPDPPSRLNPLDPATEVQDPDPFALATELEGDAVSLSWQASSIAEIAGWVVLRSDLESFDDPDTLASLDLEVRSYLDTEVSPSQTYYYKVLAEDESGGISAASHLVAARIETRPIIQIDADAEYAVSRRATLTILTSAADSMWIANDTTVVSAQAQIFQSEITDWLLEAGPGTKTVSLRLRYTDGRMSPTVRDTILPEPISDSWVLGGTGTRYVSDLASQILVHASGADSLKIWNETEPIPAEWSPFPSKGDSLRMDWTFPGDEGAKTLLTRFKNDFLVETDTDTASLSVDLSPPVAQFVVTPPDSGRIFGVDASGTYDVQDATPPEELLFSWQWEDGGAWSTWTTARTAIHTYDTFGPKTIRMMVRDGVGRTDSLSYEVLALNRAPSQPTDPSPVDGSSNQSLLPTLSWTISSDPDGDPITYTVYFGSGPDPDEILSDLLLNPDVQAPVLEPGQTYYWTVVARDSLGYDSDPAEWSFATHARTGDLYQQVGTWGSQGSGTGQMEVARDVAVDARGHIYVSDVNNGRIQIFSRPGVYAGEIFEADGTDLWQPYGLAIDGDASLYVTDTNNHRVVKFDSAGQYVRSYGGQGTEDGDLLFPRDVCVDDAGNVYVLDTGNHRVQKFDATGAFLLKWGSQGSGEGQFETASGISEVSGQVFVADSFNRRIQRFDNLGQFQSSWGGFSETSVPGAVDTDSSGNVFVLERGGTLYKFTPEGVLLSTWGDGDLGSPTEGLFVDDSGHLVWVADTFSHRIQVFERQ